MHASQTKKWKLFERETIDQLSAAHIAGLKEALEILSNAKNFGVNGSNFDIIRARIKELEDK